MIDRIQDFIKNNLLPLNGSSITPDDNLFDFGLDSLKLMKLINFLEDEFEITVPYEKVNPTNLQSIKSISNLVEQLRSNGIS